MKTDETVTPTTDGNQDTAPETTPTQDDAQTGGPETGQPRMFTQADMDRIAGDRAARATRTAQEKMLEQLGIASIDEAVKVHEAHRKAQEAEMSEVEKLQTKIEAEQAQFKNLQSKHTTLLTRNAVLISAGKKEHGLSPDIHETLLKLIDMSLLNVDDNGNVTGADKAIEQAIKDHPVLKANGSRGSGVGSPVKPVYPVPEPEKGKRRKLKSSI